MHTESIFKIFLSLHILLVFATETVFAENTSKIEHEIGFYYTVQKDDTLCSISEKFFDTALKWPDLWKDNRHVTNPHQIEPGTRIRIFQEKAVTQIQSPEKIEPEPMNTEKPKKEAPHFTFSPINRVGFIRKNPIPASGVIIKLENDVDLVGEGDLVFIRKDTPQSFVPGAKFTVYRAIKIQKDSKALKYAGFHHYLTGVVEVVEIEPDYVIAKVTKSYRTILREDRVVPHQERSPKINLVESKAGIDGRVVGSDEHEFAVGDHSVAFIDKGSRDGIAPGQTYDLYLERDVRLNPNKRKDTRLTTYDIGTLVVLHTEKSTATVFIMRAQKMVYPGTKFRTPRL